MKNEKLLTVLIPSFNYYEGVKRIFDVIGSRKEISIIVSDDSDNEETASKIELLVNSYSRDDFLYFKHNSSGNAVDNWNYLLDKVNSKFFTLIHHDECYKNTFFIDELKKLNDSIEIMVLPITVRHNKNLFRHVPSILQKIIIKLFRKSGPTINFIGGPSGLLIVNTKNLKYFDNEMVFFVDVDWYYRTFLDIKLNSIVFFSDTGIVSSLIDDSITTKNIPHQKEIEINDLKIIKQKYQSNLLAQSILVRKLITFFFKVILSPSFLSFYIKKLRLFITNRN